MRIPGCTYRLQLHAGFTFDDAAALVSHLKALGVTDCYCSPIFRATAGSRHGYDVCDYEQINPELGGEEGLRRFSTRLREEGLGLLLDFVPNHMGIAGPSNRWWRDVLKHGRNSIYASFFDIYWNGAANSDHARVVAPLLPDHYGVLLEQGRLRLEYADGELAIVHEQMRFPVRWETYEEILREIAPCIASRISQEEDSGHRWKRGLAGLIERSPEARDALAEHLRGLNGRVGDPSSFDKLDRLIGTQHYRLTRWQAGAHGTNYRRFFAIDTLVGLRVEDEKVFARSHARLAALIRDCLVTGLRIDHVDGLRDPEQYLERLQSLAGETCSESENLYVLVEKILGPDEMLPTSWHTQGTTGYDFIPSLAGLLIDPETEAEVTAIHAGFIGRETDFASEAVRNKHLVLDEMFANTTLALARTLQERIAIDRRWRDLSLVEINAAVRAMLAGFRVYRGYRRHGPVTKTDRAEIAHAAMVARAKHPRLEPTIIHFVRDVLLGDYPEEGAASEHRRAMNEWALTFQQYTGAVMAKAVEDTTYYTFNRLIALNEVGGDPSRFGEPVEIFHEANRRRLARCPHSMLTTSTHDTKMSEDVRARLYALSEIPDEWRGWLHEWRALNRAHKTRVDGVEAPDADEEYRLYQTLLGAWPINADAAPDDAFRTRIRDYLRKAVTEAKVHTSAIHPNEDWLAACDDFVNTILRPESAFILSLRRAAQRLAEPGAINSLAQIVLKLTSPGVPDIYQGNETWDFSLVDPDNRREVDFVACRSLLEKLDESGPAELLVNWRDGRIKAAVTRAVLRFRREHARLFEAGGYEPVAIKGSLARHAVGFLRVNDAERLLVVVSRFMPRLAPPGRSPRPRPRFGRAQCRNSRRPCNRSGKYRIGTALFHQGDRSRS